MADIKYNITQASPLGIQEYSGPDQNLNTEVQIPSTFNPATDFIQLVIYNLTGEELIRTNDYRNAKELGDSSSAGKEGASSLYIDPVADCLQYGFTQGNVKVVYNFLRRPFSSSFYITEISSDRTEIKIAPETENSTLLEELNKVKTRLDSDVYFNELRLDFNTGQLDIAVNIDSSSDGAVLLKLYTPLRATLGIKDILSVIEEVADSVAYSINSTFTPDPVKYPQLKGPNFNVGVDNGTSLSTEYLDYNELYSYPVTSSLYKTLTVLSGSGIKVNVDYTNFENFVHFSSAYERLANYKYKLDLIHEYESARTASGSLVSASNAVVVTNTRYDGLIEGIISKFDSYEQYLYFESSSKAWPKSNSTQPYLNQLSTTQESIDWFAQELATASLYDELNESRLSNSIPEFIRQDTSNAPFTLFVDMVSQHFDNLWLYAKGVTEKYNADNRLNVGISRDLIEDTLRSLGVKLYTSNFSAANLTSLLLGEWYDSGSEHISSFITASNEPTPDQNILSETYKRIYHNLPYLIKTKGTERGLRALINCFGIPSGSLSINTFGGIDKSSTNYLGYELPASSKIRLDNTGSIVPGGTLSNYVSIQKPDIKYNQDINLVEVGFSPADQINSYINTQQSNIDIDQYIGDPRYIYSSNYNNDTNGNLYSLAETILSGSNAYDTFDFVRMVKFFDNQLFKMVKDFLPARDVVTSGIIIKPHMLNRSKVKSPEVTWTQPEYTASINTAFITGSNGGVLSNYSTAYSESVRTPAGTLIRVNATEEARINGEFGGSSIQSYTGSLNAANTLKKFSPTAIPLYNVSGSSNTDPAQGEVYWQSTPTTNLLFADRQVKYLYVNSTHLNNASIGTALGNLKPGDKITFTIAYATIAP